ncbi:hypothetical protein E2C01_090464 [Portunus trituberculatus]|uniref:Uncharacterized protein n=1 Tax=Portunus trituberculatus TaxID=210409 RepID=A0A5B7JGN2_PORTR|nr:hypothetical protein [Portunus trituberculatus]
MPCFNASTPTLTPHRAFTNCLSQSRLKTNLHLALLQPGISFTPAQANPSTISASSTSSTRQHIYILCLVNKTLTIYDVDAY